MIRVLLAVMLLAGCGRESRNAASQVESAASAALPMLWFAADWSAQQSAPVVSGGQAVVHYDIARLPRCRVQYMGFPAWDIEARWSTDGGIEHSVPVTAMVNGERVGTDVTIDVPPGHDLALWFHASDEGGCSEWDSRYGQDYHFALAAGPPTVHFRFPGWSDDLDGTLTAGAALLIDYDIRRLPGCRQDYNGLQTWDVTVGYRFDGGAAASASVTTTPNDYQRLAAPAQLVAPADAQTIELWFENHDRTGCQAWDSAFGANYHFSLR